MFLSKEQRNQLAKVVENARECAETAAQKTLSALSVHEPEPYGHLNEEQRLLRRSLRAQARQLGDAEDPAKKGRYKITKLMEKCAYDHWHRMLFARILAENQLLICPSNGVAVTIEDCRELAHEGMGRDAWDVAQKFAAQILPQIFRPDDPAGKLEFSPEDQNQLRQLVQSLPSDIFRADDTLGWMYQFWQAKKKDEVNASEKKIGADELAPVTQLFTEDYMVLFLLHNTLGAWWLGKYDLEGRPRPSADAIKSRFPYLRLLEDGAPAAGRFEGWPRKASELRFLDPCMGSGHFLVVALPILVEFREEEEGLSKVEACQAVLRDNLFGLELDPRCTQIAAFAVALKAWKLAGYRALPPLNLACSGLGLNAKKEAWLKLANGNERLQFGMNQLYELFRKAPLLGSLIDPKQDPGIKYSLQFDELQPLLETALHREEAKHDENATEMAVAARGMAHAADILAKKFTLVVTNVPYLGRGKQDEALKQFCERHHPNAKADLATCFVERCLEFCAKDSSTALVTPQNWLFLGQYKKLRKHLLETVQWDWLARLGPRSFETIGGEIVNVSLISLTRQFSTDGHQFCGIDVANKRTPREKEVELISKPLMRVSQEAQLKNPDTIIKIEMQQSMRNLADFADSWQGLVTRNNNRYIKLFWELDNAYSRWVPFIGSPSRHGDWVGRERLLDWADSKGPLHSEEQAHNFPPAAAIGKPGVLISQVGNFYVTLYAGEIFNDGSVPIIPKEVGYLPAVYAFVSSNVFQQEVRRVSQALRVTNDYFLKIPFDLKHWQLVAAEKYPCGLPKPYDGDPIQWLFNGHPKDSDNPLQVTVARLLKYRWPRQTGSSFPDCLALGPDGLEKFEDDDGIVCISAIKGEQAAEERLRSLLAAAYGKDWSAAKQAELLGQVDYEGKTLEDWLRNGFFEQHCQIFHQRPFIWHIWDGCKDGFSALVNYHKLDHATLEKLTFTYLGDWIARQKAAKQASEEGSDYRLQAAYELQAKLKLILDGETPYDIFVRWKPIEQQPIGWQPDLNDGVRLNIRPFVQAGVLRKSPKIKWNKDRGKDVPSAPWFSQFKGNRINDHHLKLAEKKQARENIAKDPALKAKLTVGKH